MSYTSDIHITGIDWKLGNSEYSYTKLSCNICVWNGSHGIIWFYWTEQRELWMHYLLLWRLL